MPFGPATVAGKDTLLTENRAALPPDRVIAPAPRLRLPVPVFWMVKVRVMGVPVVVPKSVWSAVEGLLSPSAMFMPLPCTLISGTGAQAGGVVR